MNRNSTITYKLEQYQINQFNHFTQKFLLIHFEIKLSEITIT